MSKLQAAEKTFEFFFNRLVKGYKSVMGRDPEGLDLIKIRQEAKTKQIDANKVVEVQFGKPFGEEVNALIKSGDVNIGTANKTPAYTPSKSQTDFEIQERYRSDNDKAIKAFEERMKKDKPDGMATGGRAEYYGGGQAMVGEDLSEIGHGSDSLMARNMQLAPNSMATTSTGLNYLLGQDNDTARVPYNKGKAVKEVADKGRRGFMKAAGATTAGIAALKTGLLGFADKAAPVIEKTAEAVSNTAGQVPAYFLNLVQKIKNLGDDAPRLATQDRQKVTTYKDYTLTEDVATGRQEIQRMKVLDDDSASYYGQPLTEETYMSYTPGETIIGKGNKPIKTGPEYEEGTALLRSDRGNAGEVVDESVTISDDVIEEGTMFEDNMTEFGKTKKADGGRIGFGKAGFVFDKTLKGLDYLKELFRKKDYLEQFPRVDIKKLMQGDEPITLYSGVGDRQANTLKAYKETAKDFNTTVDKVKKDNFKGQWFTPFREYASSFGNPRNIKSKMLSTELTPREIRMAKRYVDKINKKDKMISRMKMEGMDNPPKYRITTDDNTVIIPRIKLKKLKEEGKINTDYMVLDKIKNKLGLAEGGIATMLGE